jgi:hypothetical protein
MKVFDANADELLHEAKPLDTLFERNWSWTPSNL